MPGEAGNHALPGVRSRLDFNQRIAFLSHRWATVALWACVVVTFTALLAVSYGLDEAGDFVPVWRAAQAFLNESPPYNVYGYLYPPSALLLSAPLGMLAFDGARFAFTLVNGGMALLAVGLSLRLFDISLRSPVAPAVFLGTVLSAPLGTSLHMGNVTPFIVAGEVCALLAASRGRWALSGWMLGLSLALKPALLPLVLVPVLWRRWGAVVRAIGLPVVLSAVALLLLPSSGQFFSATLPSLLQHGGSEGLVEFNVAIRGVSAFIGLPEALSVSIRLLVVAACAYLVILRLRQEDEDQVSRLVDSSALILLASFLGFAFSWNYYVLCLLPLFVGILLGRSAAPRWTLWVSLLILAGPDIWVWRDFGLTADYLASARITFGLLFLVCAFAMTLVWRAEMPRGRLPGGFAPERTS